jgi:hypothetical protein
MAHSAIVIPVPELEPVIRARTRRNIPAYLFQNPEAVHAHITLLGPFVHRKEADEALLGRLREFFRKVTPFAFSLDGTPQTLRDGTVCLVPEPAAPFRELTRALWDAYPDYPPYGGAFAVPRPHMTLEYPWARAAAGADPDGIATEVAPLLPVRAVAICAFLNWYEPHRSTPLARFAFG